MGHLVAKQDIAERWKKKEVRTKAEWLRGMDQCFNAEAVYRKQCCNKKYLIIMDTWQIFHILAGSRKAFMGAYFGIYCHNTICNVMLDADQHFTAMRVESYVFF